MPKTDEQVRRAYEMLDFVERHPERHDQDFWVAGVSSDLTSTEMIADCGTTACAAGWTVVLAGGELITRDRYGAPAGATQVKLPGRELTTVGDAASTLLGLTGREYLALFIESTDLADVRKAVADIFGPRPDGVL